MTLSQYLGEPTARCRGCGGDYTVQDLVDLHNGGEHMCKECYVERHPGQQLCPFCSFFGEETEPIGNDFFGTPAAIGNVRCCEACYNVISCSNTEQEMLAWHQEQQLQEARQNYQHLMERLTPEE